MICTSSGWDDSQAPQLCVLFFFFPPSALFACCFQLTAYRSASCYGARGVIHTIRLKENSTIVDSASFRCLWLLNVYPDGFLVKLTFFRSPSSSAQCQWLAVWLGRGCKRALLVWRKIKKKKSVYIWIYHRAYHMHSLLFSPLGVKGAVNWKGGRHTPLKQWVLPAEYIYIDTTQWELPERQGLLSAIKPLPHQKETQLSAHSENYVFLCCRSAPTVFRTMSLLTIINHLYDSRQVRDRAKRLMHSMFLFNSPFLCM